MILLNKVKIIPPNNNSPIHLSTVASSSYNTTPDGNIAGEGALLVNIGSCFERKKNGSQLEAEINTQIHLKRNN